MTDTRCQRWARFSPIRVLRTNRPSGATTDSVELQGLSQFPCFFRVLLFWVGIKVSFSRCGLFSLSCRCESKRTVEFRRQSSMLLLEALDGLMHPIVPLVIVLLASRERWSPRWSSSNETASAFVVVEPKRGVAQ